MNSYPKNVSVHGNGFIQISLGGRLESRIHIFDYRLYEMTKEVNTRIHNHRFAFTSTCLKGTFLNHVYSFEERDKERGSWREWRAQAGPRNKTGNRQLVLQLGAFVRKTQLSHKITRGQQYFTPTHLFHESEPTSDVVVTLITKTEVLPENSFQASVMCKLGTEPQDWDRFSIPWEELLHEYILPALEGTPFEDSKLSAIFERSRERALEASHGPYA